MTHSHRINTFAASATTPNAMSRALGTGGRSAAGGDLFSKLLNEMNATAVATPPDTTLGTEAKTTPAGGLELTDAIVRVSPERPVDTLPVASSGSAFPRFINEIAQENTVAPKGDETNRLWAHISKADASLLPTDTPPARPKTDLLTLRPVTDVSAPQTATQLAALQPRAETPITQPAADTFADQPATWAPLSSVLETDGADVLPAEDTHEEPLALQMEDPTPQVIPMSMFLDRPNSMLPVQADIVPAPSFLRERFGLSDASLLTAAPKPTATPAEATTSKAVLAEAPPKHSVENAVPVRTSDSGVETAKPFPQVLDQTPVAKQTDSVPPLRTPVHPIATAEISRTLGIEGQVNGQSNRKGERPATAPASLPDGTSAVPTPAATQVLAAPTIAVGPSLAERGPVLVQVAEQSDMGKSGLRSPAQRSRLEPTEASSTGAAPVATTTDAFVLPPAEGVSDTSLGVETLIEPTTIDVAPSAPVDVMQPEWEAEFIDRITSQVNGEGAVIEIELAPENLGAVEVRLEITDGKAEVSFVTETRDAAKIFTQSETKLADLLQRQGLELSGQNASSKQDTRGDGSDHRSPQPRPVTKEADTPPQAPAASASGRLNLIA